MPKTKDFFIPPFNSARMKDKYLVSNILGSWDFLDQEEFRLFHGLRLTRKMPFFLRLKECGLVVDVENVEALLQGYRALNANLYRDTALHIAVVTTKCNLKCAYCQTKTLNPSDMTVAVARQIVLALFDVKSHGVSLEFQGGEPLLNWPVVKWMIENARLMNKASMKHLKISIVSNLLLLDDEKADFLVRHDVSICTSLDGPEAMHDANRVTAGGRGTYKEVIKKIKKYQKKFGPRLTMIPTITRKSLDDPRGFVDEYVALGQTGLALRPVNNMGSACSGWKHVGYSAEEFCDFYLKAMEYILKLNKSGVLIKERMAAVILQKVLLKKDPGYVDMMNPCGAGRAVMAYMPDGSCYPCDEARMLGNDMFKLGNILNEKCPDMLNKENLMYLLQAGCSDLWNYASVYSPWIGVCPVVNYALQNNMVLKTSCSSTDKILRFQFEYLFGKILEAGEDLQILSRWAGGTKDV